MSIKFSTFFSFIGIFLLFFIALPRSVSADFTSCKADAADDGITDTFTPTVGGLVPATSDTGIPINMPPSPPTPGWVYSLDQAFSPFSQIANGYLPYIAGLGSHTYPADGCYKFTVYSDGFGSVFKAAVFVTGGVPDWGGVAPDTSTRIISVTPADKSIISTTTSGTIGSSFYISEDDYVSGMKIKISYYNQTLASVAVSPSVVTKTLEYPITATGTQSVSSTTIPIMSVGVWKIKTQIIKPSFSFFGYSVYLGSPLAASSTQFTAATTTGYDRIVENPALELTGVDLDVSKAACTWDWSSPFSMWDCVVNITQYVLYAGSNQIADKVTSTVDEYLHKAPWGYATRVYEILTLEEATSTLPSLAFTFPSTINGNPTHFPGAGKTINFSPFQQIPVAVATIDAVRVDTIDGSPFQAFINYWNMIWYMLFAFWLLRTLYGAYEIGDFTYPSTQGRKFDRAVEKHKYYDRVQNAAHGSSYAQRQFERSYDRERNSKIF